MPEGKLDKRPVGSKIRVKQDKSLETIKKASWADKGVRSPAKPLFTEWMVTLLIQMIIALSRVPYYFISGT